MEETKPTKSATWDKIAGQWKQFSGDIKKRWGDLTDDEMMEINGNREVLAGKIQERYGIAREEANKQIDEWQDEVKF
ncbi:MAG: CsbD family protein [Phototrophicales bacterium]|nr:CsbD family protein [Phototrophicales bacterium]